MVSSLTSAIPITLPSNSTGIGKTQDGKGMPSITVATSYVVMLQQILLLLHL